MDPPTDKVKHQNVHRQPHKNSHLLSLQKSLKFVISVSALSLVVWWCWWSSEHMLFFFIPHSLNICFSSTLLLSLLNRTFGRKFMFLVCNGILAFIAKSFSCSSKTRSPSGSDLDLELDGDHKPSEKKDDELHEADTQVLAPEAFELEVVAPEKDGTVENGELGENNAILATEEENEGKQEEEEEKPEEIGFSSLGAEEEVQQQEEEGSVSWAVEEDNDGKLEEAGSRASFSGSCEEGMSTDELNKKFEEFIRKMREEIRIEAQSQLIEAA